VSVITVATGAVETQISLTGITRPAIVAFRPNGDRAYVANYGSGTVSVISEPVG
jgi:DNA-binding beta-propeller fold protein YncE